MQTQDELAVVLENEARDFFRANPIHQLLSVSPSHATQCVKGRFGTLGKSLHYKVAAAGFPQADGGEWLYDMIWYTENDQGLLTHQAVVIECEWKANIPVIRNAEVDGDFQKLIQARSEVRVWISTSPNEEFARRHIENCKEQIAVFSGTGMNDKYIFAINDWTTKKTLVDRYSVG